MWDSLPELGTAALYVILISAAYTFAVSVGAGRGRPRLLQTARLGAYATCGFILFALLLLAYAFVTHDFRISYVARYSDRDQPWPYLLSALWGGQDGSLLWWLFLLAVNVAACVAWLKGRYRQLQPAIIATLMAVIGFFAVLMLFAANPFATSFGAAPPDGEGLNLLLENWYMAIHPPSLYIGFVGCTVPFAFAIAALVTGRLDNEWIVGVRKWMLFAWLFLTIGNCLGMLWSYEELGWGGYWAWDPVENAAIIPWFTATAYVHSTMVQERRNMFKVWNIILICATFFLTIFGTFLTRAGIIKSIHAFAESSIGSYFVFFMGLILATCAALIVYRWRELRSETRMESLASREAAFVLNNWILVAIAVFVIVATLFPKLSVLFLEQEVTLGATFFDRWLAPLGVVLFALMGLGPLFGWRKTSSESLGRACIFPLLGMLVAGGLLLIFGDAMGFPAIVDAQSTGSDFGSVALAAFASVAPLLVISLAGFNTVVIWQEFSRGIGARRRGKTQEGLVTALVQLVNKNRRRYGGYIVHLGVIFLFIGFTGKAWEDRNEVTLDLNESARVGDYQLTYKNYERNDTRGVRKMFTSVDIAKVDDDGTLTPVGTLTPAKFMDLKKQQPTSEMDIIRGINDLYMSVDSIDPTTRRATFGFHIGPLVNSIWFGFLIMILGSMISLWPEARFREIGAWGYVRTVAGGATAVAFTVLMATSPSRVLAVGGVQPGAVTNLAAPASRSSDVAKQHDPATDQKGTTPSENAEGAERDGNE